MVNFFPFFFCGIPYHQQNKILFHDFVGIDFLYYSWNLTFKQGNKLFVIEPLIVLLKKWCRIYSHWHFFFDCVFILNCISAVLFFFFICTCVCLHGCPLTRSHYKKKKKLLKKTSTYSGSIFGRLYFVWNVLF